MAGRVVTIAVALGVSLSAVAPVAAGAAPGAPDNSAEQDSGGSTGSPGHPTATHAERGALGRPPAADPDVATRGSAPTGSPRAARRGVPELARNNEAHGVTAPARNDTAPLEALKDSARLQPQDNPMPGAAVPAPVRSGGAPVDSTAPAGEQAMPPVSFQRWPKPVRTGTKISSHVHTAPRSRKDSVIKSTQARPSRHMAARARPRALGIAPATEMTAPPPGLEGTSGCAIGATTASPAPERTARAASAVETPARIKACIRSRAARSSGE
jgi:hypothetical protein